jgi:hypothetical protein
MRALDGWEPHAFLHVVTSWTVIGSGQQHDQKDGEQHDRDERDQADDPHWSGRRTFRLLGGPDLFVMLWSSA